MKRFFAILFVFIMIWSISLADTLSIDLDTATESEVSTMIDELSEVRIQMIRERLAASPIPSTEKDAYTFRDVPWGSTKAQAESIISLSSVSDSDNIFEPMEIIEFPSIRSGEVEGETGVDAYYGNVKVAGYQSRLYLEYIYPIEGGVIIRDQDLARLYMGYYLISCRDYTDIKGVFEDIETKLTSMYGKAMDAPTNYHIKKKWKDSIGNTIVLVSRKNLNDSVVIAYIAADADAQVQAMKNAVHEEALQREELEREKNATNVDGL